MIIIANSGSFNTSGYDGRYLAFNWSVASQSIANNQTTINWSLVGAGNGSASWYMSGNFKVIIDGSIVYSSSNRIQLWNGTKVASGTYTFTHSSDGTRSFEAYAEAGIYTYAVNCSGSGSWNLPQIARYSVIQSATDFNDEQNPSITFTNPSNGYFALRAKMEVGGDTRFITRDLSNKATSCTFNLTSEERTRLRQACANSKTLAVRFTICCMNGNTELSASFLDRKMTIVNANPTVGTFTYKDNNSTTTAITNNNQIIIRNNSTLQFTIGAATALKNSTISKYEVTFNNVTQSRTSAGTLNFGAVNVSSNSNAVLKVTDSRGNVSTRTLAVTVYNWQLPYANIECNRKNNYYTETYFRVNATYSSLNNLNTLTIQYQYKRTTASSYSTLQTITNGSQTILSLNNLYDWNLRVILTDRLGTTTYNLIVSKGLPIIYFDVIKGSVGVNCFPTTDNNLEVNGIGMGEVVLYNDTTGSKTNITLSQSAANFTYLEIFYRTNDNYYGSCKVYQPNGKNAILDGEYPYSYETSQICSYAKRCVVSISGTTISPVNYAEISIICNTSGDNGKGNITHTNNIYITRVVGYK